MRSVIRRRAILAAAVGAALLLAPVSVLAKKPVKAPPCVVSAGVTITTTKVKGKTTTTVTGTTGSDTIDCHLSTAKTGVTIHSGGGNDTISGTNAADLLFDDATTPGTQTTIYGYGGGDVIHAGFGPFGASTQAIVDGGAGNDTIIAHGGSVSVTGGEGDDSLDLKLAWGALADGGPGNDIILGPTEPFDPACLGCRNLLSGEAGNDQLYGGGGRDDIGGGDGNDQMFGGDGDDGLIDRSGTDLFDCGDGEGDLAQDFDGNGVGTDGTVGYLHAPEDDRHLGCETVRVALSAG